MAERPEIYGIAAEFGSAAALMRAAKRVRAEGYRRFDAYSPFPIEGLAEAIGFKATRLPYIGLAGGIIGAVGGLWMQWAINVVSFPLNIGGRPLAAWPAFILPAFELAVLGTVIAVLFGMLGMNGLPRLYHPMFNAARFQTASGDRFFLCIESRDTRFDPDGTTRLLESLEPRRVEAVPW